MYWLTTIVSTLLISGAIICATLFYLNHSGNIPTSIPWTNRKKEVLAIFRARLRELSAGERPLREGYDKWSKQGKPFVLPSILFGPQVICPPHHVPWLFSQPDEVLSSEAVLADVMCLKYTSPGPSIKSMLDFTVLRHDLTRNLNRLQAQVFDEVRAAIDEAFGSSTDEWSDVCLNDAMLAIATRCANHVFVGPQLCRDRIYQSVLRTYLSTLAITIAAIYFSPKWFRPLLGPIVATPVNLIGWWLSRYVVRTSLANQEQDTFTALHWTLSAAASKKRLSDQEVRLLAGKVIIFNLFALSTVASNMTNTLFDLLSHPEATCLIEELRQESLDVFPKLIAEPIAIRDMVKADSVFRETLRFNPLDNRTGAREVVQEGGLITPDGTYLPRGTRVTIAVGYAMRDPEFAGIDNPGHYDPFRFANSQGPLSKRHGMTNVSDQFLSFGLGKHACPGRFFAGQEMKMLLGHLLINYEIEKLKERPKDKPFASVAVPDGKATIRVRRRKITGAEDS